MTSGDFLRKLQKLNKRLKVTCFDNSKFAAGLWLDMDGDYVEICGVDKNEVPRRMVYDEQGHILKAGWERTLKILVQKELIEKKKAESVFQFSFSSHIAKVPRYSDPTMRQIDQIINERKAKRDGVVEKGDKYVEAGDVKFTRQDLLNARDVFAGRK